MLTLLLGEMEVSHVDNWAFYLESIVCSVYGIVHVSVYFIDGFSQAIF